MATIQIAVDAPSCTKKEFCRRTGMSGSTFDRQKNLGLIPILPKEAGKQLVLVNMVKYAQMLAEQQV